jgi:hypothetical protein
MGVGSTETENGRETSTRGVHVQPPKKKSLWVNLDSLRRPSSTIPRPLSTSSRAPKKRWTAAAVAAGMATIALAVIFAGGGSGASKSRVSTATTSRAAAAKQTAPSPYKEVPIPALSGVTGVSATALLTPVRGTTIRLTVNAVSDYYYTAILITPPQKTEALISNAAGRSQFIHRLTIQHLLGYELLRIYIMPPGTRELRPALEIPTATLAEGVIAHEPNT